MATSMDPEMRTLLVSAAREIGGNLLENAVVSSESAEQMSNQVFTLQVAAQHMLAVCAFNLEKDAGRHGNYFIDEMAAEIKKELEFLKAEGDLELMSYGGGQSH